jgi:CheY-like chemotaxis protein
MQKSSILIVEDDKDDCELLTATLIAIGIKNEFLCFQDPDEALIYLKTTKKDTFLIISDVNMPRMNGFDFKKKINEDSRLKKKMIPFVFLSTSASTYLINEAYTLSIQGYFQKPNDIRTMNNVVRSIIEYWNNCKHPTVIN